MTNSIQISPGTLADYRALAQFHYRREHPGVVTAISRATMTPTTTNASGLLSARVVDRFRDRQGLDSNADHNRDPHEAASGECTRSHRDDLLAVIVVARPRLACRGRDLATGNRYKRLGASPGAALVNREVRTISRVIVDPRHRGTGLATQLVRHVLAAHQASGQVMLTEAIAAMGAVSPLFERAGMMRYNLPRHPAHQRLLDALDHAGIGPESLMIPSLTTERWRTLAASRQAWLDHELRTWFSACHRERKAVRDRMTAESLLHRARREALSESVYFVAAHSSAN